MIAQAKFKGVRWMLVAVFVLVPTAVLAQQNDAPQSQQGDKDKPEAAQAQTKEAQGQTDGSQAQAEKDKVISGMSILGNQEAPKALVIVPWKRSELGSAPGISPMLDDSKVPVDKEVFMRMLSFYEIRSTNSTAPATAQRSKP